MKPCLHVCHSQPEIGFRVVSIATGVCFGFLRASSHDGFLIFTQEEGARVISGYDEVASRCDDNSHCSLDDVEPAMEHQLDFCLTWSRFQLTIAIQDILQPRP